MAINPTASRQDLASYAQMVQQRMGISIIWSLKEIMDLYNVRVLPKIGTLERYVNGNGLVAENNDLKGHKKRVTVMTAFYDLPKC